MNGQLLDIVQNVVLPEGWSDKLLAQADIWEKEEKTNLAAFAQTLEAKLNDTEQKLDKLISAFLDGTVDKSAYLKKKDELVKLKTELSQKKTVFAAKGQFWLEPYRAWVKSISDAGKHASLIDSFETKLFLEKVGSNRFLKDKKVRFDFVPPYSYIPKYQGLAAIENYSLAKNKTGYEEDFSSYPVWLRLATDVRQFFEESTKP